MKRAVNKYEKQKRDADIVNQYNTTKGATIPSVKITKKIHYLAKKYGITIDNVYKIIAKHKAV